ncbi:MAG TPA: hypothetical protein PKO15_09875 [Fibrobacteria bacterium]|nr:hypothetical protein [Fibrobacteria bacterium]HOX51651.1 hypothetical protein [Fibrobacteria bacterium]
MTLLFAAGTIASIWGAETVRADSDLRLFDTIGLTAGIHEGFPLGALACFPPATAVRIGATSSYGDGIRTVGALQYAKLSDSIDVHYATAGAGLAFLLPRGLSVRGMLVLHYARSTRPHNPLMQLDGGESEFGTSFGLDWSLPLGGFSLRPGAEASVAFTTPHPSWWIWSGVDVEWRPW